LADGNLNGILLSATVYNIASDPSIYVFTDKFETHYSQLKKTLSICLSWNYKDL